MRDLARSADFYENVIGLDTLERSDERAVMGSGGRPVLELVAEPGATPPGREAGLYHVALLYPSREELARVAQRMIQSRTAVQGASDHHTHEAFYLPDPDGNGLELAADRPRDQWPDLQDAYDLTKGAPAAAGRGRPDVAWSTASPWWPAPSPACASATCTCTWATWTRAWPSTAT